MLGICLYSKKFGVIVSLALTKQSNQIAIQSGYAAGVSMLWHASNLYLKKVQLIVYVISDQIFCLFHKALLIVAFGAAKKSGKAGRFFYVIVLWQYVVKRGVKTILAIGSLFTGTGVIITNMNNYTINNITWQRVLIAKLSKFIL